jgi:hypothetical protein
VTVVKKLDLGATRRSILARGTPASVGVRRPVRHNPYLSDWIGPSRAPSLLAERQAIQCP